MIVRRVFFRAPVNPRIVPNRRNPATTPFTHPPRIRSTRSRTNATAPGLPSLWNRWAACHNRGVTDGQEALWEGRVRHVPGAVIDWVGGLADLRARVIRTIGDPGVRLREDPVRMLRAVALAVRLDF